MYKLLIVDDNAIQIKSLLTFIDWQSFDITQIKTASNGKKGLEIFKNFMPDIVITDVVMPIMDGIAMTKEIQQIQPDVSIIYMSCYEDAQYLKSALDNKVASYILKPINAEELTKAVAGALNQLQKGKRYEALNQMFERNQNLFRENFLFRLLYSNHVDFQFVSSTSQELGFSKFSSFLIVRFEITSDVQEYIDIYALSDYINQNILRHVEGHVFVETKKCLNLIVMGNPHGDSTFLERVTEIVAKYMDAFSDTTEKEFSIGFSKPSDNLLDAPVMLRQASYVLENNLNMGEDNMCFFQQFNHVHMEYNIVDLKKSLDEMISQKASEAVELFLERYWLKNETYHVNEIKSFCLAVMVTLQLLLYERNFDLNDVFDGDKVIWEKLERFETVKDARMWLFNMLSLVIAFFGSEEESRQEKLVSDIMGYIDAHYGEVSNVEQIASSVYISPSYAKSLFKKSTGKTISEYLNNKRMQEAKRLLDNPQAKVYEVAKSVGYKSKPYFIKAFKKYTGQLPSEYQKK